MKQSTESVVPTFILQSDGLAREGLRLILSSTRFRPQGVGTKLEDLSPIPADVPTMFVVATGADRASICKTIKARYPLSLVVAIGEETRREGIMTALHEGADAMLFRSVTPNALIDSLEVVANGQLIVVDERIRFCALPERLSEPLIEVQAETTLGKSTLETGKKQHPADHLSPRETAILERLVRGDSNKHIARFFNIAEPTVKAHVKAIFRKIGANNRTQAAIWALNHQHPDTTDRPAPAADQQRVSALE